MYENRKSVYRPPGEKCYLRKAEWKDMDMLFVWANDAEVRKNSFRTEPVGYEEHQAWFKEKCKGEKSQIYIFCDGDLEAGMLRLDFMESNVVISYSIAKKMRNRGYGKRLIKLAECEACRWLKSRRENVQKVCVKALVKEDNLASNRIFNALKYEKRGMEYWKEIELGGQKREGGNESAEGMDKKRIGNMRS